MRKTLTLLILVLGLKFICLAQTDNPIIENVRLFDGDSVYQRVTIVTENGKITQIVQNQEIAYKAENVIDGSNYTLIPGMINSHFHTKTKKNLKTALKSGVLCVLDMMLYGSINFETAKRLSQKSNYPYFYSANIPVTVPNGHAAGNKNRTLNSEEETTSFVEKRISEGSDYIKIMFDHGYKHNKPTLTEKMLATTIKVANENNKLSVGHISRYDDAVKAAELGISGLAHVWLFDSIPIPEDQLQILKANEIFVIPTLFVFQNGVDLKGNPDNMNLIKSEVFRLYKIGIPILAGSDPYSNEVNFGNDLVQELKLFVELGIPEVDALKTATSNASRAFDLDEKGLSKRGVQQISC